MRDGSSKLAHDQPEADGARHSAQVLQFRPRERSDDRRNYGLASPARKPNDRESELLDDLARYEQGGEDEHINYRHRMLMNVIAVLVVTMLVGIGVWLADRIAEMERDQDCVLQGRQNCAPIEVPAVNK